MDINILIGLLTNWDVYFLFQILQKYYIFITIKRVVLNIINRCSKIMIKIKNDDGITLSALVVTIILLLVLARD